MAEAVNVTRTLARFVVEAKAADVPAPVRKEAVRSLLNWAGCAGTCPRCCGPAGDGVSRTAAAIPAGPAR